LADRRPLNQPADDWQVLQGVSEGHVLFTRFDKRAGRHANDPRYAIQIGVAVPLRAPDSHGLPNRQEIGQLEAFEDALMKKVAKKALLVGVITTNGMREFVLYTGSGDWIPGFHEDLKATLPTHQVQVVAQTDPSWSVYRQFVK
jgi:uncharacterized protein DUF695